MGSFHAGGDDAAVVAADSAAESSVLAVVGESTALPPADSRRGAESPPPVEQMGGDTRASTPPDLPHDPPGRVRCLCTFVPVEGVPPSQPIAPPKALTAAEAAAELQGWRAQLGIAPWPQQSGDGPLMLLGPGGAEGGGGQQPAPQPLGARKKGDLKFGLKAKPKPVRATKSAAFADD